MVLDTASLYFRAFFGIPEILADDGTPVAPAIAPRLFDPYVSGSSGKDNMGLGLAIVKKIIVEHGGDIGYAEREGRPCFTITLPRVA